MGSFRVERVPFNERGVQGLGKREGRYINWPTVYTLNGGREVYVGETGDVAKRLKDHLANPEKQRLDEARIVLDDEFNKSACLDLESHLITWLAGDGKLQVLNGNAGQADRDYFRRGVYREAFNEIFETLRAEGLFTRSLPEIENQDLFKLSPFKALTPDQALSVEDILRGLFDALESAEDTLTVVQGEPGTGKTVVAIYLMKLLRDINVAKLDEAADEDARFSEFFTAPFPELLQGLRIALVVPQQSLRQSVRRVFAKTQGLSRLDVITPYDVGSSDERYDLLIVDEAHRLNQRAAQASGPLNARFRDTTVRLFGEDDPDITQLDWIRDRSRHQILFVDTLQSVRPADLPSDVLERLAADTQREGRLYRLRTQHRVRAGEDYIGYVRSILAGNAVVPRPNSFAPYDLRFFDDLQGMRDEILRLDETEGLARLLAGFAWKWTSKGDKTAYDIELDGLSLRWNGTDKDWVASDGSVEEVGSIHTIQGYDLNYAGVIVGPDLRFDPSRERIVFDRTNYFDAQGMKNNRQRGITYSDDDILRYVRNVYGVLLTRGTLGTFIYVCDAGLREYLRPYFSSHQGDASIARATE